MTRLSAAIPVLRTPGSDTQAILDAFRRIVAALENPELGSLIVFGTECDGPVVGIGVLTPPNAYMVGNAGDALSDVSFFMKSECDGKWEAGMVGAITDSVLNQSYHIKEVRGTHPAEVFESRVVVWQNLSPRYPFTDFYAPSTTTNNRIRVHAASGLAMLVFGNSNGEASPTGTGDGLEISYDLDASIARITPITHDAFYRPLELEGNYIGISTGPVFLAVHTWQWTPQGSYLGKDAISKAATASISNAGAAGIALMSGYVPGTDVLTALGGTGTAPTFTVTHTQVSRVNSIAAAGTGGTPGAVVLTGTLGTGTKFQVNGVIGAGGTLTSVGTFVLHGDYTVNPTTLTAEPVTGGGLTSATLNISMGALTVALASDGALTVVPGTPTATSSSAAGTGATLFIQYTNGVGTINIKEGNFFIDGLPVPIGVGTNGVEVKSDLTSSGAAGLAQIVVQGVSNTNQETQLGYRTDTDHGFVQAVKWGTAFSPLDLNPFGGDVAVGPGKLIVGNATPLTSTVNLTNGAAGQAGTLLNAPAAGNPTKWIPIDDNGVVRYIPAW